jgi:hypothetical protein
MTATNKLAAALLLAGAVFAAAPGHAATCNPTNLTTSTACQDDIPGGPGGNVTTTQMNAFNGGAGVFGVSGWTDLGKIETTSAAGVFPSDYFSVTTNGGNASGTWSLNADYKFTAGASYAFVLKGGTDNVAYLLDSSVTSGSWTNLDLFTPNGKNNAGLSNMTLYGTTTPAPVPLPAAAWLLVGGIAGLGAVARRRRGDSA